MARARDALRTVWTCLLLVGVLVLGVDGVAMAATDPERAAQLLEQAERDDAALALEPALQGYEAALRLDPSMPRAMRAERRAAMLRERAEGGFAPLAALERVRRDPALASDPLAIDALLREADTFPPGIVRVEVWVLAAEAYARRIDRPLLAVPLWQRIARDPRADSPLVRSTVTLLAEHHLARGEHAAARAALTLAGTNVDPKLVRKVERAARRHWLHLGALGVLGAMVVLTTAALVRALRGGHTRRVVSTVRTSIRLVVGFAAFVAIAGGLLASGYEAGTSRPFLLFGSFLLPLLLLARTWSAAGSPATSARVVRAVLCATSALGAAFLVLEHVDIAYLEGIGL